MHLVALEIHSLGVPRATYLPCMMQRVVIDGRIQVVGVGVIVVVVVPQPPFLRRLRKNWQTW